MTSFYDLDNLIELNEKRMEQYEGSFRKIVNQFTFLMVIYSAVAIFLVPIVQTIFFSGVQCHWLHCLSFYVFCALMMYSLFYAVKLLIPAKYLHLLEPKDYYGPHREYYERKGFKKEDVDTLLKASYVFELQRVTETNKNILTRKNTFYNRAFTFAIFACIPYLICLGFHVSIKDNKVYKVEIVK